MGSKSRLRFINNTVLEINTPDSGAVTFTGTNGILWLDQRSTFTGEVSGFGAQNAIDLPGIAFDAQTSLGYSPNSNGTGGTLSLTDGAHSAKVQSRASGQLRRLEFCPGERYPWRHNGGRHGHGIWKSVAAGPSSALGGHRGHPPRNQQSRDDT